MKLFFYLIWIIIKTPFLLLKWTYKAAGFVFENKSAIKEASSEAYGVGKSALVEIAEFKRDLLDEIDKEIKEYQQEKSDDEFERKIKQLKNLK